MRDGNDIRERMIDDLVSGQSVGRITLASQIDNVDALLDVDEALSLCDASIDELLAFQSRLRARAVIKAKALLESPWGKDMVWEAMQPDEENV